MGVNATFLIEGGNEVHQKCVCHTQGTPQRVADGKINGKTAEAYDKKREGRSGMARVAKFGY